jgi:peptidoglycan/xylan/chitin deacetylase (PgdA/CDA1 family)
MHVAGSEPLLRQMYAQGSEIGNHSWDHADFTKLSPAQMQDELQRTQAAIISAGVPAPYLFRPPYGAVDATVLGQVTSYTIARWNIDTEDWLTKDPVKISEHLLHDARPGGVILMHDRYDATVTSLEPALETLKQSYQFVTLGQLLNTTPGDHGQYFGR